MRRLQPAPEVGQVDVRGSAAMEQSVGSPERNASNESFEVAGVEQPGASRVLLVFLQYGIQQRLMAILQSRQDTLERLA